MKKGLKLLLSLFLLISLMSGCSFNNDENKKITLRIAHVEAEDRSTHKALLKFKEEVEKESNNQIEVDIFANGLLGGDRALAEGVELGTVHMALPATSVLTAYDEKFGILDMPFLFNDAEKIFASLDGELGTTLNDLIKDKGLHNLGYFYNGGRSISNNIRPIKEPKDLKGLKIRVMESPVFIQQFKLLGANPTPMNFGEVFTALQQGTVDGQENAPSLVYASRFDEVQKYYSLTNHVHSILAVLINPSFYDNLSEENREIIDTATKNMIEYQRKLEIDETDEYIVKLEEKGMQVNEISEDNYLKFAETVKPIYESNMDSIGKDLFDLAEKYNK